MGPFRNQNLIVGHGWSTLPAANNRILSESVRSYTQIRGLRKVGEDGYDTPAAVSRHSSLHLLGMDEIRQLASREVYRSPWMAVREDEVEFPSGTRGTYSVVDKQDFVVVLPYADGGFWLVQQFRYPVGRREWEFPQGGWPAGHTGPPADLAVAELREETGFEATSLRHLGHLYAAYGYSSQGYDAFLATGLTPGPTDREATEADMVHEWRPEEEVRAMIGRGEFADAHSVAALALYDLQRGAAMR
ncbi:MAG: ADP-ribose pyrophosphatase [Pseudonocardiales bacterium]|jgi:8-oxo-dGTP pyrophosphatase MutT (NUDIX family)|nr:ADP-ribose pyrophosphatase [Pseudonocardiales bacterium]